jgi:hypothetical protein
MALAHIPRIGEDDDPLGSKLAGVFGRVLERADTCGKLHPLVGRFLEAGVEDELVGPVQRLGEAGHTRVCACAAGIAVAVPVDVKLQRM